MLVVKKVVIHVRSDFVVLQMIVLHYKYIYHDVNYIMITFNGTSSVF